MKTPIIIAALLGLTSPALAQPENPLRGPEVPDSRTQTLVRKTMTGRLERLRVRPEAAAVQELSLDEETAERARGVIDARMTDITMMLVDDIETIKQMTDKNRAGDTAAAQATFDELWERFEPGAPKAPLAEPLAEVLDEAEMRRVHKLVDEYWDALIDWELRNNPQRQQDPATRERVQRRIAKQLFQREVTEAYEASLRRYQQALDGVYAAVDPTPEQRERIRRIIIDHIKATRLRATPEERREANMTIYRMLDDERKEKLFAYMTSIVIRD